MPQEINPLICYLWAKDITQVTDELKKIQCDKLFIKHYAYPYPHRIARDFFLKNKQYTHLIIQPPDLVVTVGAFYELLDDIKSHPFLEIIGGVCNVDLDENKDKWAVCFELPHLDPKSRVYNWVKAREFDPPIIRVRHAGFTFMFMSRNLIENLTVNGENPNETRAGFDGTDLFNKDGYAADLWFSTSCYRSNVPIYVDTRVKMKHLRFEGELLVGKKKPIVEYSHGIILEQLHEYDMDIMPDRPKRDPEVEKQKIKDYQKRLEKQRIEDLT